MTPEQSKKFLNILSLTALGWLLLGALTFHDDPVGRGAFIQVFIFTALDLGFLILLFWKLFFTPAERRGRNVQALIFLTFKLVCLGFLAITLKRLRNAPGSAVVLGVGFMAMGPLLAAVFSRKTKETQQG